MNKTIALIIGVVLIAGGSFYAGVKYNQSSAKSGARNFQTFGGAQGQFAGRRGTGANAAGAGFLTGTIIAKDDKSITVKSRDGGSKIVFVGNSTMVMKAATGSIVDLSIGQDVTTTGSVNSDGSVTASSVQIRPAGMATSTINR
jgi:hypothetical protein